MRVCIRGGRGGGLIRAARVAMEPHSLSDGKRTGVDRRQANESFDCSRTKRRHVPNVTKRTGHQTITRVHDAPSHSPLGCAFKHCRNAVSLAETACDNAQIRTRATGAAVVAQELHSRTGSGGGSDRAQAGQHHSRLASQDDKVRAW